jgi:hypothetical protein
MEGLSLKDISDKWFDELKEDVGVQEEVEVIFYSINLFKNLSFLILYIINKLIENLFII